MVLKNYIEKFFISKQCLIDSLKVILEENTFNGLAFQATWFNPEFNQPSPSLCPCGKI